MTEVYIADNGIAARATRWSGLEPAEFPWSQNPGMPAAVGRVHGGHPLPAAAGNLPGGGGQLWGK